MNTYDAIYENGTLHLSTPLSLPNSTPVKVTIEVPSGELSETPVGSLEAVYDVLNRRRETGISDLAARIDATTLIAAPGLARTDTGLYFDQAAVGRTLDDPIVSLYDGTLIALTRRNVVEVPDDLLAEIEAFASDLERRDHAFAVVVQPAGYDPPVPQGPVIALPGGGNDPDRWTPN